MSFICCYIEGSRFRAAFPHPSLKMGEGALISFRFVCSPELEGGGEVELGHLGVALASRRLHPVGK